MTSLRARLTLALSLVLLAAAGLLAFGLQRFPRELVEDYVVSHLEHDADLLYVRVEEAGDPEQAALTAVGPVYQLPLSGHYFRIAHEPRGSGDVADAGPDAASRVDAGEVIQSRSLWDEALPEIALGGDNQRVLRIDGPAGQSLLAYARRFAGRDANWIVTVAEDVSRLDAAIGQFRRWLLGGVLLALLALVWLQRQLIVRGLAPLESAAAACARLERGESVSLGTSAPDEVRPMIDAVNRLVHHQTQRLSRVRHAAGNLSHALKTPLTVLGQLADEISSSGDDRRAASMRTQLATMRETIEREMRRARLAGSGVTGEGFEAHEQLAALAAALQRLHAGRQLRIEVVAPTQRFALDREDMLELFGNLLDNACKWAKSRVRIELSYDESELRFFVDDDGPGVAEAMVSRLGAGAVRIDESRPGHGLGLTIVADIVAQYSGTVAYRRSQALGGLQAYGALPLARAGATATAVAMGDAH